MLSCISRNPSARSLTYTNSKGEEEYLAAKFWQQWEEHRGILYSVCLKLMNFNSVDAEDALSQAMLKAWEKIQNYAGTITNFKAWLVQLTRNLCIDIIRKRSRAATGMEEIESVGTGGELETESSVETPEVVLEKEEKYAEIREAIASLPERFRETYILHFYEERSHQEIARVQGISYDNVCKRISLARKILKEKLSCYFKGEEKKERSPQSTPKKRKKSQPKEKQEKAIATSEHVPEEVAETPQSVIEEESNPTRKKPKKPKPEKLITSAIAILPPERIPKEKKRSRLSFVEIIRLLSWKIEKKSSGGKEAIAQFWEHRSCDRPSTFFSQDIVDKVVMARGAIAPLQKRNLPSRSPPKLIEKTIE